MFDWIWQSFANWLKSLLVSSIKDSLSSMFSNLNSQVNSIGQTVGQTPQNWNGNIFNIIKSLSQSVIMPVAGIILALVACYELIALISEKNNLQDLDSWIFFKWIFKTAVAVELVAHTFDIVMGVFDLAQDVVQKSAGVITGTVSTDFTATMTQLVNQLNSMDLGPLLGLYVEVLIVRVSIYILEIVILLIVYGRMIEIYLYSSIGAIPMATLTNREWGDIGKNYLKSLFALGFQGFFIMVCVAIYSVLVATLTFSNDIHVAIWTCLGYTVLLCFALFKTGSLSKSIFNAH
ncbi:MAG: CD0415/CD1112 family protein [Ethanoligenens sp.]